MEIFIVQLIKCNVSIFQEEREKRLETLFEATDDGRDDGPQQGTEVGGKHTQESVSAADSIIEALDMAESELDRLQLHKVGALPL